MTMQLFYSNDKINKERTIAMKNKKIIVAFSPDPSQRRKKYGK